MKRILSLSAVMASVLLVNNNICAAQTNSVSQTNGQTILEQVTSTAKATVTTNINQVVVEMLSGVKLASGEIYDASKAAIKGAVDFAVKETPDVVRQFLVWRFYRSSLCLGIWVMVSLAIFFFVYKLRKYQDKADKRSNNDDPSEHSTVVIFKWFFSIIAILFIFCGVGTNAFEMVKIKVAPKVYILEYVIDSIKGVTPASR